MKIVFEHQGRKTTILGNDYETIIDKIRALFPDQNHRRIQFYDSELTDFFEFTSYEQVKDQPNGLKMNFDMSNIIDSSIVEPLSPPRLNENENSEKNENIKNSTSSKRSRKKSMLERDVMSFTSIISIFLIIFIQEKVNELPTLPMYCDTMIQGLQSRGEFNFNLLFSICLFVIESFPAIQKEFLRQTCTHILQQYPDDASKNIHHSFVMSLIQKFPALNYLDKSVDGIDGKAPYVSVFEKLFKIKKILI